MTNTPDFLNLLSKNCLKKQFQIKSNFNSNGVRSFYLYKGKTKVKFTHSFDNTILEACQYTVFETDNLFITPLELTKQLLPKLDEKFLSTEGLKIKRIFVKNHF